MSKYSGSLRTADDNTAIPATLELENGRVKIEVGSTAIGEWQLDDVVFEKIPSGYKLEAEGEHVLFDLDSGDALAIGVLLNTPKPEIKSRGRRKKDPKDETTSEEPSRQPEAELEATHKTGGWLRRRKKDSPQTETDVVSPAEPLAPEPVSPQLSSAPESALTASTEDIGDVGRIDDIESPSQPGRGRVARVVDKILDFSEGKLGPYLPKWVFSRLTVLILFIALVVAAIFPGFMSTAFLVVGGLLIALGAVVYTDSTASSRLLYGRTTPSHVFIVGTSFLVLGILLATFVA